MSFLAEVRTLSYGVSGAENLSEPILHWGRGAGSPVLPPQVHCAFVDPEACVISPR